MVRWRTFCKWADTSQSKIAEDRKNYNFLLEMHLLIVTPPIDTTVLNWIKLKWILLIFKTRLDFCSTEADLCMLFVPHPPLQVTLNLFFAKSTISTNEVQQPFSFFLWHFISFPPVCHIILRLNRAAFVLVYPPIYRCSMEKNDEILKNGKELQH